MSKNFLMLLLFYISFVFPQKREVCVFNIREEPVVIICRSLNLSRDPIVKTLSYTSQAIFSVDSNDYSDVLVCYDNSVKKNFSLVDVEDPSKRVIIIPGVNA